MTLNDFEKEEDFDPFNLHPFNLYIQISIECDSFYEFSDTLLNA